jgi:hypothetical protein
MTQRDWLTVGIKLIGVYFAVLGVTASVMVGTNIVVQAVLHARESASEYRSLSTGGVSFVEVLQPVAYLLCAWALLKRTQWCLRIADPVKDEA